MGKSAAWAKNAGAIILSFSLFLLLLEFGLRLSGLADAYVDRGDRPELYSFHKTLGYTMKPGLRDYRFEGLEWGKPIIRTNSLGLRGPEWPKKKADGERWILLLGDSVVAGLEVAEKHTMASKLEGILGKNYRVFNGGVRGFGTAQSWLLLDKVLGRKDFDAVILLTVPNDISDNVQIKKPAKPFQRAWIPLSENGLLGKAPLPFSPMPDEMGAWLEGGRVLKTQTKSSVWMLGRRFQSWRRNLALHRTLMMLKGRAPEVETEGQKGPGLQAKDPESLAQKSLFCGLMKQMESSLKKRDIIFGVSTYHLDKPFGEFSKSCLNDPTKFFELFPEGASDLTFKNDPHLTPKGHEAYARAMAKWLTAQERPAYTPAHE